MEAAPAGLVALDLGAAEIAELGLLLEETLAPRHALLEEYQKCPRKMVVDFFFMGRYGMKIWNIWDDLEIFSDGKQLIEARFRFCGGE